MTEGRKGRARKGASGNDPINARMICPFYRRVTDNGRVLVCEGITPSTEVCVKFRGKRELERYAGRYCETYRYEHCPVARMVEREIRERQPEG